MSFKEFELSSCDGASFLSSDISYVVFPMSTFKVPVQVCGVCGDVVAFFISSLGVGRMDDAHII